MPFHAHSGDVPDEVGRSSLRSPVRCNCGHVQAFVWQQWAFETKSVIQPIWITKCDSTRSALVRVAMEKPTDNRLGITIASLRQAIWRRPREAIGAPMASDTVPSVGDATDMCADGWSMLVDALTKPMTSEKLALGYLQQAIESIVKKREKQRQSAAGKNHQKEKKEQQVSRQLEETRVEVMDKARSGGLLR